jgi:hypothetical protein
VHNALAIGGRGIIINYMPLLSILSEKSVIIAYAKNITILYYMYLQSIVIQ